MALQQPVVRALENGGAPEWLWPGRMQAGTVTVIEGDAGSGKSFVACDLAARFSRGTPFPAVTSSLEEGPLGGVRVPGASVSGAAAACGPTTNRPAGNVLLVTLQEGSNVVDNRLQAMGADSDRILMWGMVRSCEINANQAKKIDESPESPGPGTTDESPDLDQRLFPFPDETAEERPASFPFDLPMIEYYLQAEPSIGLVVIDPLSDFCPTTGQLDLTLRKLQIVAQRTGVAIVVTLPAYARFDSRGAFKSSSRWKSDAARAVWSIAVDPDDRQRRLFFPRRTNGMAEPHGLEFRLVSGQVAWNEQSIVSFDDPLGRETEIRNFLKVQLQHNSRSAREIFQLGSERGYTRAQIRQVAKRMGIIGSNGPGIDEAGEWTWRLPVSDELPRVKPLESAIEDLFEKSPAMQKEGVITAYLKSRLQERLKTAADQSQPGFQAEEFEPEKFQEEFPGGIEHQPVTSDLLHGSCDRGADSVPAGDSVVPSVGEPNRAEKMATVMGGPSDRRPNAHFLMAQSRKEREERRAKRKQHRRAVKKGRR